MLPRDYAAFLRREIDLEQPAFWRIGAANPIPA
jgi:hypothetical protein